MKTSNKVLFGGLATILLVAISLMAIGRSNMKLITRSDCNKLPRTTKTLQLEFTAVDISHNVEAVLKQGDFKVEIDATESALPHINHHVENGVLKLYLENLSSTDVEACPFNVVLTAPKLDKIYIAHGSQITNSGTFETPNLEIEASHGSLVDLTLKTGNLKTNARHSANIEISGEANSLDASASHSSQIQLPNAQINTAQVDLSHSSMVMIHADTISNAYLAHSSMLNYIGETVIGNIDARHSSGIKKLSEGEGHIIRK
jgi:hypothetical protein